MAYSESTWSSVGYRRRGGRDRERHHHRDSVVTATWPRGQAEAWFLLVIITAAVLIGVFASLMMVQQRMDLGVPWLFPYAISTGSITIFVIIILALFSKNNTLTPQLLIVLSFILFVLYLTGLIQTGIMLFGNGRIHANCQASVANNPGYDLDYLDYDYMEDEYDEDGDDDYEYDTDLIENDCNFSVAAKFDDLDLPPGVEATVPWLQKPVPERPTKSKMKAVVEDEVDRKFKLFKQFDTVLGHSDHHFSKPELLKLGPTNKKPAKDWAKRIQNDWKVLEKDLPETIYVRLYEDRMDLLRAAIVGPAGTPYHDGLFFFDIYYPPSYPNEPPKVHYHSGGLRLNPNLYNCGKVCLSLLNTWSGSGCERWNPANSTMLQVLVSIQALVLNAKPYFNEPGYAPSANTPHGEKESLDYNEKTFLLSCKTMLYTLRRPPQNFEDLVAGHFRKQGRAILVACKAYMDGAQVGCVVGDGVQDVDEGDKSCSSNFKSSLKKLFEDLLMEFTVKGADCDQFLAQKVKDGASKAVDTRLKL